MNHELTSKDVFMTTLAAGHRDVGAGCCAGTGSNLRSRLPGMPPDLRPGRQLDRLSLYFYGPVQIVSFRPRSPMPDQPLLRTANSREINRRR